MAMPEKFFVAAKAWVKRNGQTLVVKDQNGVWDLPGGRIDRAEFGRIPFHEVLKRELREEIGLDASAGVLLGVSQWTRAPRPKEPRAENPVRIFVVHFGVDAPAEFVPTLSPEHTAAQWVDDPYEFLPRDLIPENGSRGVGASEPGNSA
jgi:8-oxo-dGTP pyrophosphatase MutT (NUDIX family)